MGISNSKLQSPLNQNNLLDQHIPTHLQNNSHLKYIQSPEIGNTYNGFKTKQGNIVWACGTNLAFNDFKQSFLNNKNLSFRQKISLHSQQILNTLNSPKFTKSNIKENSIYIKSGLGNETIKTINRQVKTKFPLKTQPPLQENMNDDGFVSYAYLMKALAYEHEFERLAGILWFGTSLPNQPVKDPYMVQGFSATTRQCRDQIKIISYEDRQNYFLGFKAKSEKVNNLQLPQQDNQQDKKWFKKIWNFITKPFSSNPIVAQSYNTENNSDVIYLLCSTSQSLTIDKVIEKVKAAQKQNLIDQRPSYPNLQQFMMPVIDLDLKHQYEQFKNLAIANSQLKGKKLKICQNIKLRMDQKGVIVQNEAWIQKDQCAVVGNIEIRVDRPFWLILTQQGKHPYLVVKINWLPQKVFKQNEVQGEALGFV